MSEHLTQPECIAKLEVELGDAEDRIERLRARVAKLEAALRDCVTWVRCGTEFESSDAEARQLLNRIAALSETVEA